MGFRQQSRIPTTWDPDLWGGGVILVVVLSHGAGRGYHDESGFVSVWKPIDHGKNLVMERITAPRISPGTIARMVLRETGSIKKQTGRDPFLLFYHGRIPLVSSVAGPNSLHYGHEIQKCALQSLSTGITKPRVE